MTIVVDKISSTIQDIIPDPLFPGSLLILSRKDLTRVSENGTKTKIFEENDLIIRYDCLTTDEMESYYALYM